MAKLTSYRDRTALVSGASSGIGRLLALRLAREGARVALLARRTAELEAVAGRIAEQGGEALVVPCDVADRAQVEKAADRVGERFGAVDLLVNNAGYGHRRRFLRWDLDDMERLVRVNLLGSLFLTKALLPAMVERGEGWIVFVSSVAGKIAPPGEAAYAASKFGMRGLAEALSVEVEDAGIHVLTVLPGTIRTPFFDEEALASMPPAGRRSMAAPEGLVEAMVKALAQGRRELWYPRPLAAAYLVRVLAPRFFRWGLKRTTLPHLESPGGLRDGSRGYPPAPSG